MSMPSDPPKPRAPAPPVPRRRWSLKLLQIILLLLLTLAASWPIAGIVEEREARQSVLREEFVRSWGLRQVVRPPTLAVPYRTATGRGPYYLKLAPRELTTQVTLVPEQKKRGLFSATVYTATVEMTGSVSIPFWPNIEQVVGEGSTIDWKKSVVMMQATELGGMTTDDHIVWNGVKLPWRSCAEAIGSSADCKGAVLVANPNMPPDPSSETDIPFKAMVTLRGTGDFRQILDARESTTIIKAPWSTPSFVGTMLPSRQRVGDNGFEAEWFTVNYAKWLIRSTGTLSENVSLQDCESVGVDLLEAVPTYRMINRASKYTILFVVLSFTVYALFELLSTVRIHNVQYGLLGLSMTLFNLLLVSFAEPLGYAAGYGISTALVLTQATLYTAAVTRRALPTVIFGAVLSTLFGFLYVLLSMETYALLAGSVALFVVLSAVMAVTQRIDWRAEES
ncbi:cell envelope integrity protein CreD [Azospirillum doebereinerae]|uniref:Cell envelope integrity protein CreD n=1 Tax=Azospirillum doebereinerae TaxID=92933 RepID=A0A433J201_9PROT|nr:cell envelope integrity protein CreD [Azospirillum doebereinerae]RUQ65127.1 cell envelope integrity protein CreD [Azospirillum doebereinerae]